MTKAKTIYEQFWGGKRYLRKLTCTKACKLSHPEKLVLSYIVYKARNKKGVLLKAVATDLGLDRRTVSSACKALSDHGFIVRENRRWRAIDPISIKPEWFASPRKDGEEWWLRVRTYRHFLLEAGARRSRGNKGGRITESDNAVLWMLYSFGKGKIEVVNQRISGLANALGMSQNTIRAGLKRLSAAKLIKIRAGGFTLLEPDESLRSWWQDSTRTEPERQEEEGSTRAVGERDEDRLDRIEKLVGQRFGGDTEVERDQLVQMVMKCCDQMVDGRVKSMELKDYWEEVLGFFRDSDQAWDFCAYQWPELWKDAYRTHASNGKYSGSCIKLLTANTRTRLSSQRNPSLT